MSLQQGAPFGGGPLLALDDGAGGVHAALVLLAHERHVPEQDGIAGARLDGRTPLGALCGQLAVYAAEHSTPWRTAEKLADAFLTSGSAQVDLSGKTVSPPSSTSDRNMSTVATRCVLPCVSTCMHIAPSISARDAAGACHIKNTHVQRLLVEPIPVVVVLLPDAIPASTAHAHKAPVPRVLTYGRRTAGSAAAPRSPPAPAPTPRREAPPGG